MLTTTTTTTTTTDLGHCLIVAQGQDDMRGTLGSLEGLTGRELDGTLSTLDGRVERHEVDLR